MEQNTTTPAGEDKTVAIVSYLSLIGWIIALVLHGQKKTALGSYHLRQSLGILLTGVAVGIAGGIITVVTLGFGGILMFAAWILMLVMWIMGLIAAINGEQKPTIILGKQYQEWFKNAFN